MSLSLSLFNLYLFSLTVFAGINVVNSTLLLLVPVNHNGEEIPIQNNATLLLFFPSLSLCYIYIAIKLNQALKKTQANPALFNV